METTIINPDLDWLQQEQASFRRRCQDPNLDLEELSKKERIEAETEKKK